MKTGMLLGLAACALGAKAAEPKVDILTLPRGKTQSCRVVAVEADGRVRFVPVEGGAAAVMPAGQVRNIQMSGENVEAGATHTLVLRNGDCLAGELLELDEEVVEFRSALLGDLELKRGDVARIRMIAAPPKDALAHNFDVGGLGPWTGRSWMLGAGGLTADPTGGLCTLIAPLKQEESVEIELLVNAAQTKTAQLRFLLCSNGAMGHTPRLALWSSFRGPWWRVGGNHPKGGGYLPFSVSSSHAKGKVPKKFQFPRRGVFRMTYDRATKGVDVWVNGEKLVGGFIREELLGHKPTHVLVECGPGVRIERVYAGPLRKTLTPVLEPQKDTDGVQLASGDTLACTSMILEDDRLVVESAVGQFEFPLDKLACIVPRSAGRAAPRAAKGVVYVRTARSALTLQLRGMNAEQLQGRSAVLGDVRLKRKTVTVLTFAAPPAKPRK